MQSLISNLCYALPWGIVVSQVNIDEANAWSYHKWMLYVSSIHALALKILGLIILFGSGGSLVFSLADVLITDSVWAWALLRGYHRISRSVGARLRLPRRMAWMRQLYVKIWQSLRINA
jgi:hypothetical protein